MKKRKTNLESEDINALPEVKMKRKKLFQAREADGGFAETSRANRMKSGIHDIAQDLSEAEGSDSVYVEESNVNLDESSNEDSLGDTDSSEGLAYEMIFELVKNNIKKSVKSKKRCARITKIWIWVFAQLQGL